MSRLDGRCAVVTGAARGLGLATARRLAAAGAHVLLSDTCADEGEAQAGILRGEGHDAYFVAHDVTDPADWAALLDVAVGRWGRVDILVNNAGIAEIADIETLDFAGWRRTLSVNLDSVFLGTQAAIARMKVSGGGAIVNVASIEGLVGEPLLPAYNASKGGVRLLTRSAAIHCASRGYGIRINAVCPGFANTRMISGAVGTMSPRDADTFALRLMSRIPMHRFADPDEIARAVVFLASDDSSYMTGADLVIDGGYTAC
ncbi:bacilysin biosynthesis oxidoreductase BacC (plasmid) [Cupriavidus necator N-1]|uniref:Bacilysin biosynthesis oxidoreductase BacC n=1 Tax=Cupriavidus necator (strain ATCC 43291 / DSM 13513 / CCUG 52238 / LMG 8453 / N-1) TaxID=1042878 RepID=F8GU60_CUPNN|nr:glucose 1-dehydrogenase [Cupriavidus necator]AEI82264.1 bacilysin biosynthesis oxidoreductase BacC [Cupriavidus necator N-1]MDX6007284.1 glucose 1-dehydrogenase [Cupriavidus necator]